VTTNDTTRPSPSPRARTMLVVRAAASVVATVAVLGLATPIADAAPGDVTIVARGISAPSLIVTGPDGDLWFVTGTSLEVTTTRPT